MKPTKGTIVNNVELREVLRLGQIIADIQNFKSTTLCNIPEEELEEALTDLVNVILVLLDKSVHMHPLFENWPIIRDVYHGRMTAEEAIQKSHP